MIEDDVTRVVERARETGRLALDTEFLPEGRYRPLLCLIQVAVDNEILLLDPLLDSFDPEPWAQLIEDPAVEIVLHAGRQDVAILRREWEVEFTNLFDTQVAAGFAGFSAQAGYTGLIQDVLGIKLAKTASFTRWDVRPLSEEQMIYAREDVEHLLELATDIQNRLGPNGRLEWAWEECLAMAQSTDIRDPDEAWRRLPRATSLSAKHRAVAKELAAWRERVAEAENRPLGSVLKDQCLVEIAKRQPLKRQDLGQIRGLMGDTVRRRGDDIIAAVERGMAAEPIRLPEYDRSSRETVDGAVVALAEALVRSRTQAAGLAYELVASKSDLNQVGLIARRGTELEENDVRTLQGWRRELVGEELLALLRGEVQLRVGENGRVEVG